MVTARGAAALQSSHRALLGDFLGESDLVKFARHIPTLARRRARLRRRPRASSTRPSASGRASARPRSRRRDACSADPWWLLLLVLRAARAARGAPADPARRPSAIRASASCARSRRAAPARAGSCCWRLRAAALVADRARARPPAGRLGRDQDPSRGRRRHAGGRHLGQHARGGLHGRRRARQPARRP